MAPRLRTAGSLFAIAVAAMVCLAAWLYLPGLEGPFVFDDYANLPALGSQGPINSAQSLIRYLTAGTADPTGRPVSMASFLLDAYDWPTSPLPFKRTNLVLHLLNGTLLAYVLLKLGTALDFSLRVATLGAFFGAAMWTLHPFFVSTVLYVVQREAMLPATFAMLSLLIWLRGREAIVRGSETPWLSTLCIGVLTAFATFAKANGLLIPLLLVSVEAVFPIAKTADERRAHQWSMRCFGPIAALVVLWLTWAGIHAIGDPPISIRGWTIGQRLLTEPSILMDYLGHLWLLEAPASSVFHDQFSAATGFFTPWYTAVAITGWTALLMAAWVFRHRIPPEAIAVLFFISGHLMESSSLALELYFEHRNYLPAMLMFWPLGLLLARLRPVAGLVAGTLILIFAGVLTRTNAELWGDPLRQARVWATIQPDSPRAQAYAAQTEAFSGAIDPAIRRIDAAVKRFSTEPQIAFTMATLHCVRGFLAPSDVTAVRTSLRDTQRDPGRLLSQWVESMISTRNTGGCDGLSVGDIRGWITTAASNPGIASIPGRRQDLSHLEGLLYLTEKRPDDAVAAFESALEEEPTARAALSQAAALGRAGWPELGLHHLDLYARIPPRPEHTIGDGMPWIHDKVLERQRYWSIEIDHLRAVLNAEARKKNG